MPPLGLNLFISSFRFNRPVVEPLPGRAALRGHPRGRPHPRELRALAISNVAVAGDMAAARAKAEKEGAPPRDAWMMECVQEDPTNPQPCSAEDRVEVPQRPDARAGRWRRPARRPTTRSTTATSTRAATRTSGRALRPPTAVTDRDSAPPVTRGPRASRAHAGHASARLQRPVVRAEVCGPWTTSSDGFWGSAARWRATSWASNAFAVYSRETRCRRRRPRDGHEDPPENGAARPGRVVRPPREGEAEPLTSVDCIPDACQPT